MFRRILATFDGSENAECILPWLKRFAGPVKAEVYLLKVLPLPAGRDPALQLQHRDAHEYLQRMERELNYAGLPTRVTVRAGRPAAAIAREATQLKCDIIVIATRGGSPVARWLVGGTTEQVMRVSKVPVLVVRSQTPLPRQARVSRILVPVDGSLMAESILPWVEELARLYRARPVFLHVYPGGPAGLRAAWDEGFDALEKRMARAIADLRARGVKAQFRVRRGDPASVILEAAEPQDLIAMTTRGLGGFRRWILGSVAGKVIHEAKVPVLVYPPAAVIAKRSRQLAAAGS